MEFPSIEKELGVKRTDLAENGGEIDSERLKKLVGEYYNSITPAQRRSFLLTLGLNLTNKVENDPLFRHQPQTSYSPDKNMNECGIDTDFIVSRYRQICLQQV